jgi:hypothetical protein
MTTESSGSSSANPELTEPALLGALVSSEQSLTISSPADTGTAVQAGPR